MKHIASLLSTRLAQAEMRTRVVAPQPRLDELRIPRILCEEMARLARVGSLFQLSCASYGRPTRRDWEASGLQ